MAWTKTVSFGSFVVPNLPKPLYQFVKTASVNLGLNHRQFVILALLALKDVGDRSPDQVRTLVERVRLEYPSANRQGSDAGADPQ